MLNALLNYIEHVLLSVAFDGLCLRREPVALGLLDGAESESCAVALLQAFLLGGYFK